MSRQPALLWFFRCTLLLCGLPFNASAAANSQREVNITATLPAIEVMHQGKPVRIERTQEQGALIDPEFALTSRPCPPYCIQPMQLAPGVETLGELELLHYLQKTRDDSSVMVIDSREPVWLNKGMIPGAKNIPWTRLFNKTATETEIAEVLQFEFNALRTGSLWNFESVKTLVFYCNGPWCGQSPTNIRALLALGYPAHKLKWYRGGMQGWKQLGLTTVTP
ncbi:MAG: rhodanese-like domain-containing protein [Gammaproteobacteria bacterium]